MNRRGKLGQVDDLPRREGADGAAANPHKSAIFRQPETAMELADLAPYGAWKVFRTDRAPAYGDDRAAVPIALGNSIEWPALMPEGGTCPPHIAVEFPVPRNVRSAELEFVAAEAHRLAGAVHLEYWYDRWTGPREGGWVPVDDPWNGAWRRAVTIPEIATPNRLRLMCDRITAAEGEIKPYHGTITLFDQPIDYRRALKFRVVFDTPLQSCLTGLRLFGMAPARRAEVEVVFAGLRADGPELVEVHGIEAYAGRIIAVEPVDGAGPELPAQFVVGCDEANGLRITLEALNAAGLEDAGEESLLTVHSSRGAFTVRLADLDRQWVIDAREQGVAFLSVRPGTPMERLADYRQRCAGRLRTRQRIAAHSEQTLARCLSDRPGNRRTADHFESRTWQVFGLYPSNQRLGVNSSGELRIGYDIGPGRCREMAEAIQADFFPWGGTALEYRFGSGLPATLRHWDAVAALDEDGLPFLGVAWTDGGIQYRQETFLAFAEQEIITPEQARETSPAAARVRITAMNTGAETASASLHLQITRDGRAESLCVVDDLIVCEQVRARICRADGWEWRPAVRRVEAAGGFADTEVVTGVTKLEPSAAAAIEFEIPIIARGVDEFRTLYPEPRPHEKVAGQMRRYWTGILARQQMKLEIPEPELMRLWNANLIHVLSALRLEGGVWHVPAATWSYAECPNETYYVARSLDMRGLHDWAFKCCEGLLRDQGTAVPPGAYSSAEGSLFASGVHVDKSGPLAYGLHHGAALATLGYHCRMRRDADWIRRHADQIAAACEFIVRERSQTQRLDATGRPVPEYGLLVPGKQEDNETWACWMGNNVWAYHGLSLAAEALVRVGDPRGARFTAAAESYRAAIVDAFRRAGEQSPLVTLADGTAVPHTPSVIGRPGRARGWINEVLYGPIHLHTCGLLPATDPIIQHALDDFEDNLALSRDWGLVIPPHPSDWFSEGGRCAQHTLLHTVLCYLEMDEIPAALRAFYNTLCSILHPEMAYASEWSAYAGRTDGPPYKVTDESSLIVWLRWLLVLEQDDCLRLLPATPREWLRHGRRISVNDAPTFFGPVSVAAVSRVEADATIIATVDLRRVAGANRVTLRLRHPAKLPPVAVAIDGEPWTAFDPEREEVALPIEPRTMEITVQYST